MVVSVRYALSVLETEGEGINFDKYSLCIKAAGQPELTPKTYFSAAPERDRRPRHAGSAVLFPPLGQSALWASIRPRKREFFL
jgi:hypothetical protein